MKTETRQLLKSIVPRKGLVTIPRCSVPRRTFQRGGAETCGAELSNAIDEKDTFILFFTSSYS